MSNAAWIAFNQGEWGPHTSDRTDQEKARFAADQLENWSLETQGPMSVRPGTVRKHSIASDIASILRPFVFSSSQKNGIMLSDLEIRILADGVPVTRPSVSASVTNGTFSGSLTGWTNISDAGTGAAGAGNQGNLGGNVGGDTGFGGLGEGNGGP